mmetsp:Transcript_67544/g.187274  ORF Transcript_67544/g.187274 Transcript_67544/m.187274 type:complete len:216 (+) Transcript_67544:89-736(+)
MRSCAHSGQRPQRYFASAKPPAMTATAPGAEEGTAPAATPSLSSAGQLHSFDAVLTAVIAVFVAAGSPSGSVEHLETAVHVPSLHEELHRLTPHFDGSDSCMKRMQSVHMVSGSRAVYVLRNDVVSAGSPVTPVQVSFIDSSFVLQSPVSQTSLSFAAISLVKTSLPHSLTASSLAVLHSLTPALATMAIARLQVAKRLSADMAPVAWGQGADAS